jgi:cytochrome c
MYVVRAAYKDKGSNGIPAISAEKILTLRNAKMPAGKADKVEGIMKYGTVVIASVNGSHIGFSNIDLTGIEQIKFTASAPKSQLNAAGGLIEVRLGSPTGKLIGQTAMISPPEGASPTNMPPTVEAGISGTKGINDVYFVFKNDKAPAGQALFVVIDVEFQNNKSAATNPSQAAKATTGTSTAAKTLDVYVGKYKMSGLPFEYIEISTKEGKLHISAGGNEGDLSPGQEADVFAGDNGAELLFGRNADKKVTTLTLKAQGFTFEGNKE